MLTLEDTHKYQLRSFHLLFLRLRREDGYKWISLAQFQLTTYLIIP